jgi:cytoskeleton-associated protein 5
MDGPPPVEEDFSTLPVVERLSHKNWKARVSGYEALVKIFQATGSDTDPAFRPYINNPDLLKKIATDSNAVAQEKGVECLVTLVKYAGESAAKTRDTVVPALVDKCFGSTRAGTKTQAIELALQYVEVENNGTGVVVHVDRRVNVHLLTIFHRPICFLVCRPNSQRQLQAALWR